jgi:hypothetical protein
MVFFHESQGNHGIHCLFSAKRLFFLPECSNHLLSFRERHMHPSLPRRSSGICSKHLIKFAHIPISLALFLFAAHCNFTTQSYNMGKLLNPGESMTSVGVGGQPWYTVRDSSTIVLYDSGSGPYYVDRRMKLRKQSGQDLSFSYDYRLGVLDNYPLGKGLEFGFHLEAPTPSEGGGSVLLDIDLRGGLPPAVLRSAVFNHSIGLGWNVGMWVDNGWYAEYAAGLEYNHAVLYSNIRILYTATDMTDVNDLITNDVLGTHKQFWNVRQCLGLALKLPRLPVVPDYIVPEVTLAYPNYNRSRPVGFTYHIGLRWLNGF